jgi:hypothetical protein
LDKSIDLCANIINLSAEIDVVQEFNAEGATLPSTSHPHAVRMLMMIGAVFQLLSDVLYKRYREDKRFALQTRGAVASAEAMQIDAKEAAQRLTQHLTCQRSCFTP